MKLLEPVLSATCLPNYTSGTPELALTGEGSTRDVYGVTELATSSIAAASLALARYAGSEIVTVDRRLASFWFHSSFRPQGQASPKVWDELAGDYETSDGWIRLHTNLAAHKQVVRQVLDDPKNRAEAEYRVKQWKGRELQETVVGGGGAAAVMLTDEEWSRHLQGTAVSGEPLVRWTRHGSAPCDYALDPGRPLAGLKVLDLTRILAGPVSTRFLASYGADVLRIDPPFWDEIGNIPEMTPGKRCATLDFSRQSDKDIFAELITEADIFVHGYRADALDRLGFGETYRRALNPGLIDVALNAYGWTGPWNKRRGFDSLVQMSSGIADFGMKAAGEDRPHPLTVQALDHATGYLMAAAVMNALHQRQTTGEVWSARLSLAATAELLKQTKPQGDAPQFGSGLRPEDPGDLLETVDSTAWGPAQRLKFPMTVGKIKAFWNSPATPLHTSSAEWS